MLNSKIKMFDKNIKEKIGQVQAVTGHMAMNYRGTNIHVSIMSQFSRDKTGDARELKSLKNCGSACAIHISQDAARTSEY